MGYADSKFETKNSACHIFLSRVELRSLTAQFPFIFLCLYFRLLIKFVTCVWTVLRFKAVYYHLIDDTFPIHYKRTGILMYHNMHTNGY